jgi:hypothetical protein
VCTRMGSGVVVRRLLASFLILVVLLWAVSLVVLFVDDLSRSARLATPGPLAVGLGLIVIEIGFALVARHRIGKSRDWLESAWTLVGVVAALCLAVINVYAGVSTG